MLPYRFRNTVFGGCYAVLNIPHYIAGRLSRVTDYRNIKHIIIIIRHDLHQLFQIADSYLIIHLAQYVIVHLSVLCNRHISLQNAGSRIRVLIHHPRHNSIICRYVKSGRLHIFVIWIDIHKNRMIFIFLLAFNILLQVFNLFFQAPLRRVILIQVHHIGILVLLNVLLISQLSDSLYCL